VAWWERERGRERVEIATRQRDNAMKRDVGGGMSLGQRGIVGVSSGDPAGPDLAGPPIGAPDKVAALAGREPAEEAVEGVEEAAERS
jgi:hypothetical protein